MGTRRLDFPAMKARVRISDHALLRYAERVKGVDLDPLRQQIVRDVEAALDKADLEGASAVVIDGMRYALSDNVITTIHQQSRPCPKTGMVKGRRGAFDE